MLCAVYMRGDFTYHKYEELNKWSVCRVIWSSMYASKQRRKQVSKILDFISMKRHRMIDFNSVLACKIRCLSGVCSVYVRLFHVL